MVLWSGEAVMKILTIITSRNEQLMQDLEEHNRRTLLALRVIIPVLLLLNLAIWEVI